MDIETNMFLQQTKKLCRPDAFIFCDFHSTLKIPGENPDRVISRVSQVENKFNVNAAFSVKARPFLCIYVVGHRNIFCLDLVDAFWYLCYRKTTNAFLDSICALTERYLRRQPAQMLIDWPLRGNHQGSLLYQKHWSNKMKSSRGVSKKVII